MAKDKKGDKEAKKQETEEKKAKSKKGKSKKLEEEASPVETEEDAQIQESKLEEQTPAEKAKEEAEEEAEELGEKEPSGEKAKAAEEEAEAPAEEEEEEELEIVEEKFYNLNLRKIWSSPREKRTPRAVRFLRDYVGRHMKTDEVAISEEANSMLWQRGISKPPRKIRVRAVKDKDGRVIVFPGEGK
jgi:large subunit ribosomal protein L31e